jgi:hypothetical protein
LDLERIGEAIARLRSGGRPGAVVVELDTAARWTSWA